MNMKRTPCGVYRCLRTSLSDAPSPSFLFSPSSSCSSTLPGTPAHFWEEKNSCMIFMFDHHPLPMTSNCYIVPDVYVMPMVFMQSKKQKVALFDDDLWCSFEDDDDDGNDDYNDNDKYSSLKIENPSWFCKKSAEFWRDRLPSSPISG